MKGFNAIVTGASRGIGRAAAIRLAQEGCNVLINSSSSLNDLMRVRSEILGYNVKCEIFSGDIGRSDISAELIDHAHKALGDINILINNAGISRVGLLQDMTFEDFDRIMKSNLYSVFNMCKGVIPDMVSNKQGKIINISSVWGLCGASCEVAYSATKGGINAFTKALGKELAPSNIQVNAIACGIVDTAMNSCFSPEDIEDLCSEIPVGRMASCDEVSDMIIQLLNSPAYLNGEVIKMDGGWT